VGIVGFEIAEEFAVRRAHYFSILASRSVVELPACQSRIRAQAERMPHRRHLS
jgi:hypothetical protein